MIRGRGHKKASDRVKEIMREMHEKRESTLEMRRKLEAYKNKAPLPKGQSEPMPKQTDDQLEVGEPPLQEEEAKREEPSEQTVDIDDTVSAVRDKKKVKKAKAPK